MSELMEAICALEKEKGIRKEILIEAVENALMQGCKAKFGKNDNFTCKVDQVTGDFRVIQSKEVVEEVTDDVLQISLEDARKIKTTYEIGDTVKFEIKSTDLGRIAIGNAKNSIIQKLRENERQAIFDEFNDKVNDVVTGIVQRSVGRNLIINLGKADAILNENEMVKGEHYRQGDRIKVYVHEVKSDKKGIKILVSRTHPNLVKKLFEAEVSEVQDGTVEIKNIAREPGSRTKMAVYSSNPDVDPVGACVGVNGSRVNAVVDELKGEKIDIINWSDNPANLIENALSPAKVVSVGADEEEKSAIVVVPDYQLSLAIGRDGQNARLAARLTNYKIDIKSETQAKELGLFDEYYDDYNEGDEYYDYRDGEKYEGEGYEGGDDYEGDYADDNYEASANDGSEMNAESEETDDNN